MKTSKLIVLFLAMFVIAASAGVMIGRLIARPSYSQETRRGSTFLREELQLTADQSEKMRPLWESARDTARACAAEAEQVQHENDSQLRALLTDEQKGQYEEVSRKNHAKIVALDARRKEAFRGAVDLTRAILNPEQQKSYEQILKTRVGSTAGSPENGTGKND